jgi:L-methionine (R)-S-oxide reductase
MRMKMQQNNVSDTDKESIYKLLLDQLESLLDQTLPLVTNLSNVSALLNEVLDNINWVGFYLLREDTLILAPFQGKVACTKIPLGKGVCGAAAKEARTLRIDNVHQFPGHISCDCASNSEIVIPITINGKVIGVLDIDSPKYSRFDTLDQEGLEAVVHILEKACNWSERIV